MKKKLLLFLILAAFLSASCGKDKIEGIAGKWKLVRMSNFTETHTDPAHLHNEVITLLDNGDLQYEADDKDKEPTGWETKVFMKKTGDAEKNLYLKYKPNDKNIIEIERYFVITLTDKELVLEREKNKMTYYFEKIN